MKKLPYIHSTQIPAVGTSFSTTKRVTIPLRGILQNLGSTYWKTSELGGVQIQVSGISSATQLTVRISSDPDGDNPIVPDATAAIWTGVTTATKGAVVLHGNGYPAAFPCDSSGNVYLFIKTDAGTVDVDRVVVTFVE